jgi:pre-mRNA-splicing factor ATP-dependent RNA helicase DHX38/PRP16
MQRGRGKCWNFQDASRTHEIGWDSTPRRPGEDGPGWGRTGSRRWDAPTPKAARGGSPNGEDAVIGFDMREWEEEQVRLDRDWYTGAEDGGVAGDEEHNPLSQYEDLNAIKQAEIATKQVVSFVSVNDILPRPNFYF